MISSWFVFPTAVIEQCNSLLWLKHTQPAVMMDSVAFVHGHGAPLARADHLLFTGVLLLFLANFGPFPRSRCVLQQHADHLSRESLSRTLV